MIFVDSRELRSRIPHLLKKLYVPYKVVPLKVADYIVGDVAVERKEIGDYLGSLASGHLANQLYELSYNFDLSYLFIEGLVSEALMYRKLKRVVLISSIIGSSLKVAPDGKRGRVITVNLENPWDTALALKCLHDKVIKGESRLPRMKKVKANPDEILVYVVSSIPGLGEKRAKLLLKKFGSIKNIVTASPSEILSIPGFGEEITRKVMGILHTEYKGE